jgi:hypothetical protein
MADPKGINMFFDWNEWLKDLNETQMGRVLTVIYLAGLNNDFNYDYELEKDPLVKSVLKTLLPKAERGFDGKKEFIEKVVGGRPKRDIEEEVRGMLKADPNITAAAIGEVLNCSDKTVRRTDAWKYRKGTEFRF